MGNPPPAELSQDPTPFELALTCLGSGLVSTLRSASHPDAPLLYDAVCARALTLATRGDLEACKAAGDIVFHYFRKVRAPHEVARRTEASDATV